MRRSRPGNAEIAAATKMLDRAGKYLAVNRKVAAEKLRTFTAITASCDSDPDVQALALLSVLLARTVNSRTDGWDTQVMKNLGIEANL